LFILIFDMKFVFRIRLLFIFFLANGFFLNSLSGQINTNNDSLVKPSIDSLSCFYFYKNEFNFKSKIKIIDTSLVTFHRYDPVLKGSFLNANIGNFGPHKTLFNNFTSSPFDVGESLLNEYSFTHDNIPYYILKIPYSNIMYVLGPREENFVDFTLANQMSPGLYFGTDLRFESLKGIFNNQRSANNHFRTNISFTSRNMRYGIEANYIRNKFKFEENGGLVNDFYYEDTTKLDRRILPVNLYTASNQLINNRFLLSQYFSLGKSIKLGSLFLDIDYSSKNRIYSDLGDVGSYYNNSFIDTSFSFDSIASKSFNSFLGWQKHSDSIGWNMKIGVQNSYNEYFTGNDFYVFNYIVPKLFINYIGKKYTFGIKSDYSLLSNMNSFSYNENSFNLSGEFGYIHSQSLDFKLSSKYSVYSPEFRYFENFSNHYIWSNSFNKISNLDFIAQLTYKGYDFMINNSIVSNYVWFDDSLNSYQNNGLINILRISINKEFKIKRFGADFFASWQKTDNLNLYRIPTYIGRSNIYFSFPMFKGVLDVFPGLEFSYISSYFADGYNPSAMIFYLQDDKKIDNQIYIDVFVNFKIKRAKIFLMYKNVNMLIGKYNYFQIAHYPQQDPGLKMGVSWRFYD
jgi:hypothetical protein